MRVPPSPDVISIISELKVYEPTGTFKIIKPSFYQRHFLGYIDTKVYDEQIYYTMEMKITWLVILWCLISEWRN